MVIRRIVSGPIALFGLFLCLACVPPPTVVTAPTSSTLGPGEGAVILSLTSNSARSGQFGGIEVEKDAAAGQSADHYLLWLVSPGLSRDTSLFVGALPAGEYSFTKLTTGAGVVYLTQGGRQLLGRFRIEAGKTSDLGRLILTSLNTNVIVGRSSRSTDNADLVRAFAPDQVPLLAKPPGAGWVGQRSPDDFVEAYAQSTPIGADGMTELSNGYVVACSRLGEILVRHPSGTWEIINGGTSASLLWLTPTGGLDARLVAVGEFDTILRVDYRWKPAKVDPGNLPQGNLFFIDGNDQTGWILGHQRGTTITFYASPKLDAGDWKPILQQEVKGSIWSGANHAWAWHTPTGVAFATSFSGIQVYQRGTGTWTRILIPGNPNLINISIQDQWSILTSPGGGFGGIFASTYESSDQGKTWVEVKGPFTNKQTPACVLPNEVVLQQGGIQKGVLQLSADGGKTWAAVSDQITIHDVLVGTPTQGIFAIDNGAVSFGLAHIKHSSDLGKTWEVEVSNFNRAAYQREHPGAKP